MDDDIDFISSPNASQTVIFRSLIAGAAAGAAVDISLFPLDTIKTRLQSKLGFWNAGGFRKIYSGLGPTVLGSAPTAAMFFCGYESTKFLLRHNIDRNGLLPQSVHHGIAAAVGEVIGCLIRVPVEVIKQRSQASRRPSLHIFKETIRSEGILGLYRGFGTTVMREIPFSAIQFPLWEFLKKWVASRQESGIQPWQSAFCGSFSGAVAAALTTPLDVAKTRIMLADISERRGMLAVLSEVYRERSFSGLFAGIVPRVTWISIGGFVFLGVYDKMRTFLS